MESCLISCLIDLSSFLLIRPLNFQETYVKDEMRNLKRELIRAQEVRVRELQAYAHYEQFLKILSIAHRKSSGSNLFHYSLGNFWR